MIIRQKKSEQNGLVGYVVQPLPIQSTAGDVGFEGNKWNTSLLSHLSVQEIGLRAGVN